MVSQHLDSIHDTTTSDIRVQDDEAVTNDAGPFSPGGESKAKPSPDSSIADDTSSSSSRGAVTTTEPPQPVSLSTDTRLDAKPDADASAPSTSSSQPSAPVETEPPSQPRPYPPPLPTIIRNPIAEALTRFRPSSHDVISGIAPHVFDERRRRPRQPRRSSMPSWYYYDHKPRSSPLRKSFVMSDENRSTKSLGSSIDIYFAESRKSSTAKPISHSPVASIIDINLGVGFRSPPKPKDRSVDRPKAISRKVSYSTPSSNSSSPSVSPSSSNEDVNMSVNVNLNVVGRKKSRWRSLRPDGRALKNLIVKIKSGRESKSAKAQYNMSTLTV